MKAKLLSIVGGLRIVLLVVVIGISYPQVLSQTCITETIWDTPTIPSTIDAWMKAKYGTIKDIQIVKQPTPPSGKLTDWEHVTYTLMYKGLRVENCYIQTHSFNGILQIVNGYIAKFDNSSEIPTFTDVECQDKIKYLLGEKWANCVDDKNLLFTERELVFLPMISKGDSVLTLAYKFVVEKENSFFRKRIYIDANDATIIRMEDWVYNASALSETLYSGVQEIYTDDCYLIDTSRGLGYSEYYIDFHDMDYLGLGFFDLNCDNYWSAQECFSLAKQAALDVHWGTMKTYDYFNERFSLNILENTHLYNWVQPSDDSKSLVYSDRIYYGIGTSSPPMTSLDIVAHEVTHFVEEEIVRNISNDTILEALSDIFSMCIVHYADVGKQPWQLGEEVTLDGSPIRRFDNPHELCLPSTYGGQYWNTSNLRNTVKHVNGTVFVHWFYLLVEGGVGTNDFGNNYSVDGIGYTDAEQIIFNAWINYGLAAALNCTDAARFLLLSSVELFGYCSEQTINVVHALEAIGLPTYINIPSELRISSRRQNSIIEDYFAQNIIASNYYDGSSVVNYYATNEIRLTAGFVAQNGANVHAQIVPCGEVFSGTSIPIQNIRHIGAQLESHRQHQANIELTNWGDFDSSLSMEECCYYIYDPIGRLIKSGRTFGDIDTTNLSTGTYIVLIQTQQKKYSSVIHIIR